MPNDNSLPDPLDTHPPHNYVIELACALPDALSATRLHALLGHQSFDRGLDLLHELYPKKAFPRFKLIDCDACRLNKVKTGPYKPITYKFTQRPLQCLRMDLSGLIPSWDGDTSNHLSFQSYKCFLLIKDEYSHYLWYKALRNKTASTVTDAILHLIFHLEHLFPGYPVVEIVSDAGTEFSNQNLRDALQARGIILTHTPPAESQINGLIEREMRSIKDNGNTYLTDAGLPKAFWPQAYHHAVYLHNFIFRQRRYEYMPPPPPDTTTQKFYPFLALYGADTPHWLETHRIFLRRHFEKLTIFGQGGVYVDPHEPRKIDKYAAANTGEPAIYLGEAAVHFTSHIYVLLPMRGVIRSASYSTFTPANSEPFAYSQLFNRALTNSNLPINSYTLKDVIPYWREAFNAYQYFRNSARAQLAPPPVLNESPKDGTPSNPPKTTDRTSNEDASTVSATPPRSPSPSIVTESGSTPDPTVKNDPPRNQKESPRTEPVDLDSASRPATPQSPLEHGVGANPPSPARSSPTEMPPVSSSPNLDSSSKPERSAKTKAKEDLSSLLRKRPTSSKRKRSTQNSEGLPTRPSKAQFIVATSSISRPDPSSSTGERSTTTGEEHFLSLLSAANSLSPHSIFKPTFTSPENELEYNFMNIRLDDMMAHQVPDTFKEAIQCADSEMWTRAMHEEMSQMNTLNVWESVPITAKDLPKGVKPITCRWIFTLKPPQNGEPERYKARLIAHGNHQIQGINYTDTYSEVIEISVVRYMLADAIRNCDHMRQLDVKTAFLNADLNETIYMRQPQGFDDKTGRLLLLKKALYGLKQSPLAWYREVAQYIKNSLHFDKVNNAHGLFYRIQKGHKCKILLYVDDIIIISSDKPTANAVIDSLSKQYNIKDFGPPETYLSMFMKPHPKTGSLDLISKKTTDSLLSDFSELVANNSRRKPRTPIDKLECQQSVRIELATDSKTSGCSYPLDSELSSLAEPLNEDYKRRYQSGVGSLLYISSRTRPDFAFAVSQLCRHTHLPRQIHWHMLTRSLLYLQRTKDRPLHFPRDRKSGLVAYCDATYGGDITRHAAGGIIIKYNGCPIHWEAKREKHACLSVHEAELRTLTTTIRLLLWFKNILYQMGEMEQDEVCYLLSDSKSSIQTLSNLRTATPTMRYILHLDYLRENIQYNHIVPIHISGKDNHADGLTKALSGSEVVTSADRLLRDSDSFTPESLNRGER